MRMRLKTYLLAAVVIALVCMPVYVRGEESKMEYTATLGFANSGWTVQEWGNNASTIVTGAGTYTLRLEAAATEAELLWVDIRGAYGQIVDAGLILTDLRITADGREVAVDPSKILIREVDGNGSYRIEIYDRFGDTKDDPGIDPVEICFSSELIVSFTLEKKAEHPIETPEEPLSPPKTEEIDPSAPTQNAAAQVQVQIDPWLIVSIAAVIGILAVGGGIFLLLKKRHG